MLDNVFFVNDDDGNALGTAIMEDVTGDFIPDVVRLTDTQGEHVYLSLDEVINNGILNQAEQFDQFGTASDIIPGILSEVDTGHLAEAMIHTYSDDDSASLFAPLFQESNESENYTDVESLLSETLTSNNENIFGEYTDVSFTGLIDNGLVKSDTYRSWLDGVDPNEIMPGDIAEIASHMADEFNRVCPAVVLDTDEYGFSTITDANGIILYDVDGAVNAAHLYGIDNIVGSIAHEFGHNITDKAFEGSGIELTSIQQEMCSDYIEGIILGLSEVSPEGKFEFLKDHNTESENYPSTQERIEIIQEGYDYASNPIHRGLAPITMPSLDFIQNLLWNKVISQH